MDGKQVVDENFFTRQPIHNPFNLQSITHLLSFTCKRFYIVDRNILYHVYHITNFIRKYTTWFHPFITRPTRFTRWVTDGWMRVTDAGDAPPVPDPIHFHPYSQVVVAIERYSASTEEQETVCCFFVFQEIGE